MRIRAQNTPLINIRTHIAVQQSRGLPSIHFSTNGHPKSSIRLLQRSKPVPHSLSVNNIQAFLSPNQNKAQRNRIAWSNVRRLSIYATKASSLILNRSHRGNKPFTVRLDVLAQGSQSSQA